MTAEKQHLNPVREKGKKRSVFIRGLIALFPALITIFLISLLFNFLNNYIAKPLGMLVLNIAGFVSAFDVSALKQDVWVVSVIGFPLAIIIILFLSYLMATYLGRWLLKELEELVLSRFPLIKSIYPYAKQFSDLFISDKNKVAFKKVIAVEYPRPGIYSLAFLTSEGLKEMDEKTGREMVGIFLPNSPTPFTGWVAYVPRKDIIILSMTVEEAIRILVSGGVLISPEQSKELPKPVVPDERK